MSTSAENWPSASYFRRRTPAGQSILSELTLVTHRNWRKLYRHKGDGSHWIIDDEGKHGVQFLHRVKDLDEWMTEDHSAEEKALVLERLGGEGDETCIWVDCSERAIRGIVYCVHHLYANGGR
jgi:hypothetical protein